MSAPASLRPTRGIIGAGLIGGAALTAGIALTATSGWLIVRASERPVILTLLTAIVAVRAFGMARPVLRYAERLRSHRLVLGDLAERRSQVYAGLVPLTPARLGRRRRSDVLAGVVDDLGDVVDGQARGLVPLLAAGSAAVAGAVLVSAVSPVSGLVLAGLLALVAVLCRVAFGLERRSQHALLSARGDVQRVSDLVSRQALELQAVGGEATAQHWLAEAHSRWAQAVSLQCRGRALLSGALLVASGAAALAIAAIARHSDLSGPVAALLVVVPVAMGEALAPLPDAVRGLARARGSAKRLGVLLSQAPAVAAGQAQVATRDSAALDAAPRGRGPHLRLEGASASWDETRDPAHRSLEPVDLDLPPGRHLAIVGANGSGKSTLLAVLARHLDPSEGHYTVDGRNVRDLSLARVRSLFAIVDDEPHIFATTLRENLRLASDTAVPAPDSDVHAALSRAGLGPWLAMLPDGLDTMLGTGGHGVSGGERARLGLARALLSERPVILLDEPVAHLDHATAAAVLADLTEATHGRTVVMVSHRPDGIELFDAVLDLSPEPSQVG